jgi:hypothetical protein
MGTPKFKSIKPAFQNEVSYHLEEQMKINSNQNSKPKILKVDSHLGIGYHSDRP